MKIKVAVNQQNEYELEEQHGATFLNGEQQDYAIHKVSESGYLLYKGTKVYAIKLVSRENNELTLNIDGVTFEISVKDHIAQILEDLGMDIDTVEAINEITAPMPGAILEVAVEEGQEVKQGDTILILEAMKMENIIKSPIDATIGKINVKKGDNVEKNHVLVSF